MVDETDRLGISSDPELRRLEFLLGRLAGAWRGERDNPQKRLEIIEEYKRTLLYLYSLGWDKELHPEALLPDEYMPEEFYEHNPIYRPDNQ